MAALETPAEIKKQLNDWGYEVFERLLLGLIFHDPEFYYQIKGQLCRPSSRGKYREDDFNKPIHNEIYKSLENYYENVYKHVKKPIDRKVVETFIEGNINAGDNYREDDIPILNETFDYIGSMKGSIGHLKHIIETIYPEWLRTMRVEKLIASRNLKSTEEFLFEAKNQAQSVQGLNTKPTRKQFGMYKDTLKNKKSTVTRIGLGLDRLDLLLDGGLAETESMLVGAPSGGGKTVFATQVASNVAIKGFKVMLITTEEFSDRLETRIISNHCDIAYNLIKDGIATALNNGKLKDMALPKINSLREKLAPNLLFEEWNTEEKAVGADLDNTVQELEDSGFIPDLIILDWVGSSLDGLVNQNLKKHDLYLNTVANFVRVIQKRNTRGIVMMQMDETSSNNKKFLSASDLSECKNAHRKFEYGLGISAVKSSEKEREKSGASKGVYDLEQFHNLFKSRHSEARSYKVWRRFDKQRFVCQEQ